jgi:hypothetical protein
MPILQSMQRVNHDRVGIGGNVEVFAAVSAIERAEASPLGIYFKYLIIQLENKPGQPK